jgi:hypothetical protein
MGIFLLAGIIHSNGQKNASIDVYRRSQAAPIIRLHPNQVESSNELTREKQETPYAEETCFQN